MFRYRRVRVLTVLLGGWVALTAVERWAENSPWPGAMLSGLLWASVVAGVWWFAEWTQSPLRTARESDAARAARGRSRAGGTHGEESDGSRGRHEEENTRSLPTGANAPVSSPAESSAPSHR
ncbi:hypothetical protein AB0M10_31495 [Streptomyces sp. NPDC051840]|uniref:hypothetical protein n=1 Tax=unclassified Streptomyces TaxID=2593676 RepID=UPI00341AEBB8